MAVYECKIVTLGEGRVGKTSLTMQFVKNTFHIDEISTLSASCLSKVVPVSEGSIQLNIWDTAGQERFRALAPNYYRGAKGALVVYDITDRKSFDKVISWITELKAQADRDIVIIVAGNKSDMERDRQIESSKVLEFCGKMNVKHHETSAKNGSGVEEIFTELARMIYGVIKQQSARGRISRARQSVAIDNRGTFQKSKDRKCC